MASELADLARIGVNVTNRRLARLLYRAARHAEAELAALSDVAGLGAAVRRAQLRRAASALRSIAGDLWSAVGEEARRAVLEAADLAALHLLKVDAALGLPYFGAFADGMYWSAARAAETLLARQQFGYTLSRRIYRNSLASTRGALTIVENGLASGASWREIAGKVASFISPRTPGGVSYAAKRLAVTEINNAYHHVYVGQAEQRPWVEGFDWRLSGSHPRADVCDELASNGPYAKGEVPSRPHPSCFCVAVARTVSRSDFLQAFERGEYDAFVSQVAARARLAG